jgi:hypothetical protein
MYFGQPQSPWRGRPLTPPPPAPIHRSPVIYTPPPRYVRPAYVPPPPPPRTVIIRETVTRPDYAAMARVREDARRREMEARRMYERERFALQRRAMHDAAAAARLALLQQQLLAAQQAAAATQPPPISPIAPTPQAQVSPSSPGADLTPAQDAAAPEAPEPRKRPWLLYGVIAAGAGIGGYFLLKKKKKKHAEPMEGYRRRRR